MKSVSFFLLFASLAVAQKEHTYEGALVSAQLRCQGYLCPQWALDITRYDTVQYPDTQFEYILQEALPLAPTAQRKFTAYTSYDEATRLYTTVAEDYPVGGVDSFWQSTINSFINASTPVLTNVIIAHPDASTNHPGSMHISRVLTGPEGKTFVVFKDGSFHRLDIAASKYSLLGSLFDKSTFKSGIVTDAHVFDGSTLKSFVQDAQGNNYLVKADVSVTPIAISAPLLLIPYTNGAERPIAAHMMKSNDAMTPQLVVIQTGNFDQINWVDEATGKQTYITGNLMSDFSAIFECNTDTFDCDGWRTSSFDNVNNILYVQGHVIEGNIHTTTIIKIGFTQNRVTKIWYPYFNAAMSPMSFGYTGYQYVKMV